MEMTCLHVDGWRALPPKRERALPPKRGRAHERKPFLGVTWVGSGRDHGDF